MAIPRECSDNWDETWLRIQKKAVQLTIRTCPDDYRYAFRGENQTICRYSQSKLWRYKPSLSFQGVWEKQVEDLKQAVEFVRERKLDLEKGLPVPTRKGKFGCPKQLEGDVQDLLMDLQHRGGDTLLLDMTVNLNVALYFACIHNTRVSYLPDGYVKVFKIPRSCLWHPRPDNKRAQAQEGVHVLPCRKSGIKHVYKWVIPGRHKSGIMEHLGRVHRVHDATMFPDLEGFVAFRRFQEETGAGA